MNALADDARGQDGRLNPTRFVAHHAAIGAGENILAAIVGAFRQHREDALRR